MSNTQRRKITQEDLDKVAGYSSRDASEIIGFSKSTINDARERARMNKGRLPPQEPVKVAEIGAGDQSDTYHETWKGDEGELTIVIREEMTHENILRKFGHDPEAVRIVGVLEETHWQYDGVNWNHRYRFRTRRGDGTEEDGPAWPLVQPAAPVSISIPTPTPRPADKYKLAMKCGDHQIGFRVLPDGTLDPFHDEKAMDLFVQACYEYQPDKITVLGDFIDLPSQGRYAQEASFARTTQLALDAAHEWLSKLRAACPWTEIIIIEGNHDKRMQNFVENNALAAFGLTRANKPESWPVMSLPNLLRLEELDIKYIDAYPAATDWDNPLTRNIHGTKANSKGSTMAQYIHQLPHVNTWAGHTHRCEIVYRTVLGANGEPIESFAANPGVMCRTDGAVPSVHGAIGASGIPTPVVEDWQQGFGMQYYTETEVWPSVHRIKDGITILDGQVFSL